MCGTVRMIGGVAMTVAVSMSMSNAGRFCLMVGECETAETFGNTPGDEEEEGIIMNKLLLLLL